MFDSPVNIQAVYTVPTQHTVDLTNLNNALHDLLVDYDILYDDCYEIAYSTDGSRVRYEKGVGRTDVYIRRLDCHEIEKEAFPKRDKKRDRKPRKTDKRKLPEE